MNTGCIIVVSAPSGAGKGTLLRLARERLPNLAVTVSATTRPPRPGEVDGVEYYFFTRPAFLDGIERGDFAEWAEVHGNLYGTLKTEIESHTQRGEIVIMELDVQGMRSIRQSYPAMASIFIAPPGMAELEQRLILRGVNDPEDMSVRLANAAMEMAAAAEFDHVVVNDDLDRAAGEFIALINDIASSRANG